MRLCDNEVEARHEHVRHSRHSIARVRSRENYFPINTDFHTYSIELAAGVTHSTSAADYRWRAYLQSLPSRQLASTVASKAALNIWLDLCAHATTPVWPPDAAPTDDGGLLISWDRKGRHLEIEILPHGAYEWFYRERLADVSEGGEEASAQTIDDALRARFLDVLG